MEFRSFQERFNLSDEDFDNFEQDIRNILEEEKMFEDEILQELDHLNNEYSTEYNSDKYSIEHALKYYNDLLVDHYMTDEECPF